MRTRQPPTRLPPQESDIGWLGNPLSLNHFTLARRCCSPDSGQAGQSVEQPWTPAARPCAAPAGTAAHWPPACGSAPACRCAGTRTPSAPHRRAERISTMFVDVTGDFQSLSVPAQQTAILTCARDGALPVLGADSPRSAAFLAPHATYHYSCRSHIWRVGHHDALPQIYDPC